MKILKPKNNLALMLSTGLLASSSVFPAFIHANGANVNKGNPLHHDSIKKEIPCVPGSDKERICKIKNNDADAIFDTEKISLLKIHDDKKNSKQTEINLADQQKISASDNISKTKKKIRKPAVAPSQKIEEKKAAKNSDHTLDWVSLNKLPGAFNFDKRTYLCRGNYLEPNWPGHDFKGNANEAPVVARANQYSYETKGVSTLAGRVHIEQGNRLIESDEAFFDKENNIATLTGNISLRQPGILVTGSKGKMNTKTNTVQISDAQYVLQKNHIRGSASEVIRDEKQVLHLKNAIYTSAPPNSNAWALKAKNMTIDPNTGSGVARYATLNITDVPVLFTPYIDFPIDKRRKTGILYPEISMSNKMGTDYLQPFYINIAPNYDDTLIPRVMSDRGFMLSNQFRYLQPNFKGETGGSYLFSKDSLNQDNPFYHKHRWFLFWKHQQQLTQKWDANIDYNKAGDKRFLSDFGINNWVKINPNTDYIKKDFQLRYRENTQADNQWSFIAKTQQLQNMALEKNDPYNRLPQLTLTGEQKLTQQLSTNYQLDYTRFDRNKDWMFQDKISQGSFYKYNYKAGSGLNNAQGDRFYLKGQIKHRIDRSYGFLESGAIYRGVTYRLNNLDLDEVRNQLKAPSLRKSKMNNPETFAPSLYTGAGLFFDRPFSINQQSYTQTLEPHIQYVYTPYVKNQDKNPVFDTSETFFTYDNIYNIDRFSGYDRIGDTNHIAVGTTTRILDEQGTEKFFFGIGQIFYLKKRISAINPQQIESNQYKFSDAKQAASRIEEQYQSQQSPIATKMLWHINPEWSLEQNYVHNMKHNRINQYSVGLNGKFKYNSVFNLEYHYLSQPDRIIFTSNSKSTGQKANGDLSIAETSLALPLNPYAQQSNSLKLLGGWSYDITNKRNLNRTIGIQKDTCNYRIRLLYHSYFNPAERVETSKLKHGIFLQFMLKGLGNIAGNQMNSILQNIKGYQPGDE